MNYEINETNHFDRPLDLSNFGLDPQDPMHGATEKHHGAVGNPPEHLDLEAWEDRSGDGIYQRQAGAANTSTTQQWAKQFGSSDWDYSNGIATDSSGNVYLTGTTWGDLAGKNAGSLDVWVAKYDSNGEQQWIKQFGSYINDYSNGIATDSSGNVYLTGTTGGDLAGKNAGGSDVWVAVYNSDAKKLWAKQFGSSDDDYSYGIATDSSGNVYLTGTTGGDLARKNAGGEDAWVAKYDSNGNQKWAKQFGSSDDDYSYGIATDSSGNLYLTGATWGDLAGKNAGWNDAWVAKYDSNGEQLWAKQFGSSNDDYSYGIATDSSGNLYLTGATWGDLAGENAGSLDVWVAKYDSNGDRVGAKQFGSSDYDYSYGIATDSSGNVYLIGSTYGDLAGTNAGKYSFDAWVAKINQVPQPQVSISATDADAVETGASETTNPGEFTITRTGDTTDPLTVKYAVNGKAINGEDYQKLTGSIIIPAGETTVSLPLDVTDDDKSEYSEKVIVTLQPNFFYGVDTNKSATVTIADNEKPKVSIIAVDAKARETKVGEAVNPGKFRVIRVGDLSQPLTVTYKVDGTATRGMDYKLPSKIKFAAGVSSVDLAMPIVDDAVVEELETTTVTLTSRPVYKLATAKSSTVSIADNDK